MPLTWRVHHLWTKPSTFYFHVARPSRLPRLRPVGPRKAENSEVDQLVQRVCTGLDGTDIGAGRCGQPLPVDLQLRWAECETWLKVDVWCIAVFLPEFDLNDVDVLQFLLKEFDQPMMFCYDCLRCHEVVMLFFFYLQRVFQCGQWQQHGNRK